MRSLARPDAAAAVAAIIEQICRATESGHGKRDTESGTGSLIGPRATESGHGKRDRFAYWRAVVVESL